MVEKKVVTKGGLKKTTVSKKTRPSPKPSTRSPAKKSAVCSGARRITKGKARHVDEPGIDEKINRLKSQMRTLRKRDHYTVNEAAARWRELTQMGEDSFCPDTEHNGMARYYLEHSHYKFPRIRSVAHHKQLQPNLVLYLLKTFAAADKCGLIKVYNIGMRGDEYYVSDQDYGLLVDRGVLEIE
jgi:hypothetical protein